MADEYDQIPLDGSDFAINPEPRCACVLVLDTSESMAESIDALHDAVAAFHDALLSDPLASKRVELAVVEFGGEVHVHDEFVTADQFTMPELDADGETPMGEAIERALEMVQRRKNQYRAHGVPHFRPWVVLLTDGAPSDDWALAAEIVQEMEEARSVLFYAVGVGEADFDTLAQISARPPIRLDGLQFQELFAWLSTSIVGVSQHNPQPSDDPELDIPFSVVQRPER